MLSIIIYAQSYWSGFCRLLRLALGPGNISRQIGGGSPLAWCRLVRALWTGEGRTKYCIPILHSTGLWCMVVLASCPSVHLTLVLNWNPGHEDSVLIFNPTQSYLLYQPLHLQTFSRKGNTKLMNHNSLVLCSHEFVRRLVGFGRGQSNMYLCRYLGNQRSSITLRKI